MSLALCGSKDNHVLLRLMTVLGLILNPSQYKGDFLNDVRLVTSNYEKLVRAAKVENSFSEMAHLYAMSAALKQPIMSYFPPQINNELSAAFSRKVCGRQVRDSKTPAVTMWSSMHASKLATDFRVNHFVPLVKKYQFVNVSDIHNVLDISVESQMNELDKILVSEGTDSTDDLSNKTSANTESCLEKNADSDSENACFVENACNTESCID